MEKLLELRSVSAAYDGQVIIKNVNLDIFENDFLGIIGPNGGGKTTLVKVILGILQPIKGRVNYLALSNITEKGLIGYLPQVQRFDHRFPISVRDVALSGLMDRHKVIKKFSSVEKERANTLLDEMGIFHLKHVPIGNLSGGQLQRALLCRSLISSPKLLILDEPSTYVDSMFEVELYEKLKKLNEQMAIILVSHDIGTISYYIKTIACVNKELNYHHSNIITEKQLESYKCPMQVITHGDIPHTVLKKHTYQ